MLKKGETFIHSHPMWESAGPFPKIVLFVIFSPLESPRDASNKDSPASQADSGVYSIASSSSPSKGDGAPTAESTSPESPNRDRMAFPDQSFNNRDMQCKIDNFCF